jgi:hypothetical protein
VSGRPRVAGLPESGGGARSGNKGERIHEQVGIQVIFIVIVLVVAGVFYYRSWAGGPVVNPDINFVCVATGRTFSIDRDKINSVPLKNPETGQATLVPCVKRDGKLYMDAHYRSVLADLKEVNRYVDEKTLEVTPTK